MFTAQESARGRLITLHTALVAQFTFELISGFILSLTYNASQPYETNKALHGSTLHLLQGCHYWLSSLLILESVVLILTLLWCGQFQKEQRRLFLSTLLIFASSMGFQLSGNLLPFDRHGVQTAVIEASIGARVPILGSTLSKLTLGGAELSLNTVRIWYTLHWALSLAAAAALLLAFSIGTPYRKQFTIARVLLAILPTFVFAIFVASPIGDKATAVDFNSFSDKASWYTWPLHGSLIMLSRLSPSAAWVGPILAPTLLALLWLAIPWLNERPAILAARASVVFTVAFFGLAAVFFGGSIEPLTGARNPPIEASSNPEKGLPISPALAQQGRALFNRVGCSDCHGPDGLAAKAGPSLKTVQTRHSDANYFMRYVKNPQAVDPNSTMTAFPQLSQAQLRAIAEYLRSPNKPTGKPSP